MPGTISENYLSRPFTLGQQAGRELIYNVAGTDDEEEVRALLVGAAPPLYQGLIQESLSAEPQGGGLWKCYARYSGLDSDSEFTFDSGGGTQRITQSIQTVASYAPTGLTAPDFRGAIGVTEDRVEGTDVTVPTWEFTETHRFLDSAVTPAYKLTLRNLVGRYNDAAFREHAAGECLLRAVNGSRRGDELWAITFRFAASANATGLVVGDIIGIDKLGWDYLWVRYADFEDSVAVALVKRPVAVYVERVYQPGNFADLNIGTT
jgi:hypothetical protein